MAQAILAQGSSPLMAPLVVLTPAHGKIFVNDIALAKLFIERLCGTGHQLAPCTSDDFTQPSDQSDDQSIALAVASTQSGKSVKSSESGSSVKNSKFAIRNTNQSDVTSGKKSTLNTKEMGSVDKMITLPLSSLRLSNRFDALASDHSEDNFEPDFHVREPLPTASPGELSRTRVSKRHTVHHIGGGGQHHPRRTEELGSLKIAKEERLCVPHQSGNSRRSSTSTSRSSSTDCEMQECPECHIPLTFWCSSCRCQYEHSDTEE